VKHFLLTVALLAAPCAAQAITSSEYDKIDAQSKLDVLAGNNWYVPVGASCIALVDLAASWHDLFQALLEADISQGPVIILRDRIEKSQIIKSPNDFEIALRLMHFHPILTAQGRAPNNLPGDSLVYSVHLPNGTSPNVLIFNNAGTCQRIIDLHGPMIDIRMP
jgi:hypothetical protein